jgi:hypothetical protein
MLDGYGNACRQSPLPPTLVFDANFTLTTRM